MTWLWTLIVLFLVVASIVWVLMLLDEPPGIEPYEKETIDDFPEENDATQ